jgi:hypothetical protein
MMVSVGNHIYGYELAMTFTIFFTFFQLITEVVWCEVVYAIAVSQLATNLTGVEMRSMQSSGSTELSLR